MKQRTYMQGPAKQCRTVKQIVIKGERERGASPLKLKTRLKKTS